MSPLRAQQRALSRAAGDIVLDAALNARERKALAALDGPPVIQAFLDRIEYSDEPVYRAPLQVAKDRKGHCFDGAMFAAAMLRRLGFPPLLVDLIPNQRDDDHVLAVFRIDGCLGAIAKSNFSGLRYREPVYRSLRELVMSYFEVHFNVAREKTLRAYTVALDLARFDHLPWTTDPQVMDLVAARLDASRRFSLLSPAQEARLAPVDERQYAAGMLGAVDAGLWKPGKT